MVPSTTTSIGLVKNVPSPNRGGKSKSAGPGVWNPDSATIRVLTWSFLQRARGRARLGRARSGLTVSDPYEVQSGTHPYQEPQYEEDAAVEPLGDEPANATPYRYSGHDQREGIPRAALFPSTDVIGLVRAHGDSNTTGCSSR